MEELPQFEKLLDLLLEHQVEFIIVGGFAVVLRGYVRLTDDLDILIKSSAENVARLESALSKFGEGWGRGLSPADFPLEPGAVRILEKECALDIFTLMAGKSYDDYLEASTPVALHEPTKLARCLCCRDLIELKSKTHRPKDQVDVLALTELEKRESGT
jgi:hypothetical protein